tara:strand:- start:548 stop:778 length:231 start_codon:yes stop_codon:yes gene_type:complete
MNELFKIIAQTFNLSSETITLDLTPEDINSWDSLGQLLLINNIEKFYNISFEIEEIFRIMSIKDIYEILKDKGKLK